MGENNAIAVIMQALGLTRHDTIIPGRGEPDGPFCDHSMRVSFRRPGVPGEFHLMYRLEHVKPYEPVAAVDTADLHPTFKEKQHA